MLKEKLNQATDFVNDEVVPGIQKVVETAVDGHRRAFSNKNGETGIEQTEN